MNTSQLIQLIMFNDSPLPPGCIIRQARAKDKRIIHKFELELVHSINANKPDFFSSIIKWISIILCLIGILILNPILLVIILILIYCILFTSVNQDWARFWVIECNGRVVACAKLCFYNNNYKYSVLYSLFVAHPYRHQGIASYLVLFLIQQAHKPLYLACKPELFEFYNRLGFNKITVDDLPPGLQFDLGIPRFNVIPLVFK